MSAKIDKILNAIKTNHFVQFLLCNLIYSFSTFCLNLVFPLIFEVKFFEEFIYLFQITFFLTSMTGFGITTSLLRNHINEHNQTLTYFTVTGFIVSLLLLLLSFFPNNYLSIWLNVDHLTFWNHFMLYLSVIFTNLFLFNRALMNVEKTYILMLCNIGAITLIRLIGLGYISYVSNSSIAMVLAIVFVIPFLFEFIFYVKNLFSSLRSFKFQFDTGYKYFLSYSLQVFSAGALYVLCDRLYLIHLKNVSPDLASVLGFSLGFVGVISVFNKSFTNYFIGTINPENKKQITQFKVKVKKHGIKFFSISLFLNITICILVYYSYTNFKPIVVLVLFITIMKTSIISYLGFTTMLTKTLGIQYYDLIINLLRVLAVYLLLKYFVFISFIWMLLLISLIIIIGEVVLVFSKT